MNREVISPARTNIRSIKLNNKDKKVAIQSIFNHFEDLYNYIEIFDTLNPIEKTITLAQANIRLRITNEIIKNIDNI